MDNQKNFERELKRISLKINLLISVLVVSLIAFVLVLNMESVSAFFDTENSEKKNEQSSHASQVYASNTLWKAPDINNIRDQKLKDLVTYGKDLIAHTAKYLGPNGSVMQISNGMNCQNCHLDAGTRPWGNNYGSVASMYPKFRARSGTTENIYKRVNDCFERSLNGKALDTLGKEMQAIKAYIEFLGSNVEKGKKAEGSGFKELAYLDRAADPQKGKLVYDLKCVTCHLADGQGKFLPDSIEYAFPPLWGEHSYNNGAGLFRITNFARYVKYNMPLGATYDNPQLSDEEAWDVAAFINSQRHPHLDVPYDWPDQSKKPIDHPFGPYADAFSEKQHKFGPWKPIEEERKKTESKKN